MPVTRNANDTSTRISLRCHLLCFILRVAWTVSRTGDVHWFPPVSCNLHSAVSSSFVLRRAMPPTDMRMEAPEEELDAGTIGIGKLNDDLMHAIFTTWDAFSLATVRSVCKHWRVIAASEDLWACACRARWALRRRSNRRPYISQLQSRPASWLQAYRIYHHLRRPPAMQDRAVYADGLCGRVGAWLQVKHQQACALPLASADATQPPSQQPAQHRVLRASVLVQNLRSEQLGLMADAFQVTYRGTTHPASVRVISGVVVSADAGKQAAGDSTARAPVAECMDSACRAAFANAESTGMAATEGKAEEQAVDLASASPPWYLEPLDVACINCEITALAGPLPQPQPQPRPRPWPGTRSRSHLSAPLGPMLVWWQPDTGSTLTLPQV